MSLTGKAWFDGACSGNPGPIGIGSILKLADGEIHTISKECGYGTNNEAEYSALIALLKQAIDLDVKELQIHGDSQLVVNQVAGKWEVHSDGLRPLRDTAQDLMRRIPKVELKWVRRDKNKEADALSSAALCRSTMDEEGCEPGSRAAKSHAVVLRQVAPQIYIAEGSLGGAYAVDIRAESCSARTG